jgi:hypothetical protein
MKFRSEAFQVLRTLLMPTLLILLWMSILRLLLFGAVYSGIIGFHPDLPKAMLVGVRFDLLILGFFWIPVVLFTWLVAIMTDPRKLFGFWKIYFAFIVLLIFDLSWTDLFWASVHLTRLNSEFFHSTFRVVLETGWNVLGVTRGLVFTSAMAFSAFGMILSIYWQQLPKDKPNPIRQRVESPPLIFFLQLIGSFLLVGLAARGTLTAHHLNIEHAQVSENPAVNQIPLNPIWNMDK